MSIIETFKKVNLETLKIQRLTKIIKKTIDEHCGTQTNLDSEVARATLASAIALVIYQDEIDSL